MSQMIKAKEAICSICGKPVEDFPFDDEFDQMENYVHAECAEPFDHSETDMSPRLLSQEISELLQLAEDTTAYARRVLPVEIQDDETDPGHFTKYLVVLGFAHKVLKSTEAVMLLCRQGYGEDSFIITRSIAEAVINAARIESLKPKEGVERWGAYKIALQWRHYLRWKQLDPELAESVFTPESVRQHREEFEEVKDWFLLDLGKGMDDPMNISKNWLTKRTSMGSLNQEDIYEMARKLDGLEQQRQKLPSCDYHRTLLRTAYEWGADYAHSNPLAVERYYQKQKENEYAFLSSASERDVWHSLWSAIGGLINLLEVVHRIKPLEDYQELSSLFQRFCKAAEE